MLVLIVFSQRTPRNPTRQPEPLVVQIMRLYPVQGAALDPLRTFAPAEIKAPASPTFGEP
jgi:hypothetical protein